MIYVTSDLHGYPLEKFQMLLKKVNFSDNDYCFVLGDVIDRGNEGIKTLRWLLQQPNIQIIMGNHEAMLLSCEFLFDEITDFSIENLSKDKLDIFSLWVDNGAKPTLDELTKLNHKAVAYIIDAIREFPLYETVSVSGKDFLLTHSGLGNFRKEKKINSYTTEELLWNRPKMSDVYYEDFITVFGHTPTHFLDETSIKRAIITDTWIDIDTGAACGFAPMLLRLDDMEEFYINE